MEKKHYIQNWVSIDGLQFYIYYYFTVEYTTTTTATNNYEAVACHKTAVIQ